MLAPEFLPVWGGVGTYIVELVKHMPSNIEFHVVTPFRERIGGSRVSSSEYEFSKFFGSNVHINFVSRASDTFLYNGFFQYAVAKHVPRLLREEKIDLVHSHTAHMPDLLLSLKGLKVPVVTTIHTTIRGQRHGARSSGVSFSELEYSEKMTFLTYPFLRLVEDLYFMGDRRYITVSRWMRNQLLMHYPRLTGREIRVIHNAVDVQVFLPSDKPVEESFKGRDVVLFTGRLTAAKGVNILIDAIPEVLRRHDNAYFVFIGPGDPAPHVKRLESRSVSSSSYSFLGYVKHREQLAGYYRSATIFVAPTFYENLPIRLLEAMACGVPVVATNVCAIPEAVKNGVEGFLVPPASAEALANAILILLQDEGQRREMGRNARRRVEKDFSWTVAARKILKVYESIFGVGA